MSTLSSLPTSAPLCCSAASWPSWTDDSSSLSCPPPVPPCKIYDLFFSLTRRNLASELIYTPRWTFVISKVANLFYHIPSQRLCNISTVLGHVDIICSHVLDINS